MQLAADVNRGSCWYEVVASSFTDNNLVPTTGTRLLFSYYLAAGSLGIISSFQLSPSGGSLRVRRER